MKLSVGKWNKWLSVAALPILAWGMSGPLFGADSVRPETVALQKQYSSTTGAAAGIRIVSVGLSANGNLVDLRYGIDDLEKARKILNSKCRIYLRDEAGGRLLSIANMANVGKLLALPGSDANRGYVMMFNNAGRLVKSGGKVSLLMDDIRVGALAVR